MKKIIVLLIAVTFCLVVFASCGRGRVAETIRQPVVATDIRSRNAIITPPMSDTLADILNNALVRRESINRPAETALIPLTTGRIVTVWENTLHSWRVMPRNRPLEPIVSSANASFDVSLFFSALSSLYAPYIYFGGSAVFLPVRDSLLYAISQREYWYPCELEELIYESLAPIILDSHFRFGSRRFRGEMEIFQYNRQFGRSEYGFFCLYRGLYVHELLLQCNPDLYVNVQDAFRFSMDESGEAFFYAIVIALPAPANEFPTYYLKIVYEDGIYEIAPMEMLASSRSRGEDWEPPLDHYPSFEVIQGIPVIAIGRMGRFTATIDQPGSREARQFLALTEQVRYEPAFILDLRNHAGGYGELPSQWFRRLTRQDIPPNSINFAIRNYDSYVAWLRNAPRPFSPDPVFFDRNHITYELPPCGVVANNQLIIVLVDRYTASAGERMVDLAFSLENTLVVGQNTAGVYITGSGWIDSNLPWSGIPFDFSIDMRVFPEGHFTEGLGFAPDIWVIGDALTAALNMLNYHIGIR